MHYLIGVTVGNGRQELFHIEPGLILCDCLILENSLEQLSANAVLHHNVDVFRLYKNIEDSDNVWMILSLYLK
jgi:hypothetical protein